MKRTVTIALAAFAASPVFANPAPTGGPGSDPWLMTKSTTVAMQRAEVVITDGVTLRYPAMVAGGSKMLVHGVRYRGRYVLKNLANKPQRLRIAFPNAIVDEHYGGNIPHGHLRDFSVRVDGKRVRTKIVTRRITGTILSLNKLSPPVLEKLVTAGLAEVIVGDDSTVDLAKLGQKRDIIGKRLRQVALTTKERRTLIKTLVAHYSNPDPQEIKTINQNWHTFDVPFAASKTVTLRIAYDSPKGDAGIARMMGYSFSYTMRTGARWSGPIDRYALVLVLKTRFPLSRYTIRPKGFKRVKKRALRWVWRKFVPDKDLAVTVRGRR